MSTTTRAGLTKNTRVHRNNRRLIATHTPDSDTTYTVTYLDPHPNLPTVEHNVPAGDIIQPRNSHDIAVPGDYAADVSGRNTRLYQHGPRNRGNATRLDLSHLADRTATWTPNESWVGGLVTGARLDFKTFDDMVRWTRTKGIAPNGWTVDRFGGWVPVGDRRAHTATPSAPCADIGCDRPATRNDLCGIHSAAAVRVAANKAERDQRQAQAREQADEARRQRETAELWAQRLADTFNIHATPATGRDLRSSVALNGEALYGLLAAAAAELREVGVNLTDLVPIELAADRQGTSA
jgi:hypothetical protein